MIPGREARLGRRVGAGCGVGMTADVLGDRGAHRPPVEAHVDPGEVERVEHQLDALTNKRGVDLVVTAERGHGRHLGDRARLGPQERLMDLGRGGQPHRGHVDPGERRLCGLGTDAAVMDAFDPRREQSVQLGHVRRRMVGVEFDEDWSRTVRKNRSILPRPSGRRGVEWASRIPSDAPSRSSGLDANAEPLST